MVVNMAAKSACTFNDNNNFLCISGTDGKIKIWDTSTGVCKQEYTKNLHLSSPCTSLLWIQGSKPKAKSPKKRRLNVNGEDAQDLVVAGTTSGTILVYNVASNSLVAELDGHAGRVNSLSTTCERFFSGADDKQIIEWDLYGHKIKSKWKNGNDKVKSILALACGKKLLSASCNIKLWDLETKTLLKTFTGHATEVFSLLEVPLKDNYFVSAAQGDRTINVWNLSDEENKSGPLASFLLKDSASYMHISTHKKVSRLCAISETGGLHIFEHKLNGPLSKPLQPNSYVTVVTEKTGGKETKSVPVPVPIRAVSSTSSSRALLLVYGDVTSLLFELLTPDSGEEHIVLIRQIKRKITQDEFNSKNKTTLVSDDAEYVSKGAKRNMREVPLEKRLDNLTLATPDTSTGKKDHMVHLLLQALQSRDKKLIQDVLFRADDSVINSTVKYLPIQALVPLLRELTILFQGKTFTSRVAVRWLQPMIRIHSSTILSNPDLANLAKPMMDTVEAKISGFQGLLRLRGRLALVAEQIENYSENSDEKDIPLISYQEPVDKESEESDASSKSEEGEEWEEFSDLEENDNDEENNTDDDEEEEEEDDNDDDVED